MGWLDSLQSFNPYHAASSAQGPAPLGVVPGQPPMGAGPVGAPPPMVAPKPARHPLARAVPSTKNPYTPPPVTQIPPTQEPEKPPQTLTPPADTTGAGVEDMRLHQGEQLTPVDKRSGLSEKDKQAMGSKNGLTTNTLGIMPSGEFQEAYNDWMQTPMYTDQKQGEELQNKLAMLDAGRPIPLDLRPLAALSDAWNPGSHLAQSMPVPETPSSRGDAILKHFQQVQQDRKDLDTNIVNAIKARRGGYQTTMEQAFKNASIEHDAMDPERNKWIPEDTRLHWIQNSFQEAMKPLVESDNASKEGQHLLALGQSLSDKILLDKTLKSATGGRISMYEMKTQGQGDTSLYQKLSQMLETVENGTYTKWNRAQFTAFFQAIDEAHQNAATLISARHMNMGVKSYGLDPAKLAPIVGGMNIGGVSDARLKKTAAKGLKTLKTADPDATTPTTEAPDNGLSQGGVPSSSDALEAPKPKKVLMISPDGTKGNVDSSRVDEFVGKGFKRAK